MLCIILSFSEIFSQLSHKKTTDGGALCAISWQICGLPASFHFAATSILTPCPGAAAAETDASTDWKQAVSSATVSGREI